MQKENLMLSKGEDMLRKCSLLVLLLLFLAIPGGVIGETITWVNPTTYKDGTTIATDNQAKIKNYLRYSVGTDNTWVYFAETSGGKTTWTGTLPVTEGTTAKYSVSAALTGADNVERDSEYSSAVSYTRPFQVRTPAAPAGLTISQ